MNEADLKKAQEKLKADQEEFAKKVENRDNEFKEKVAESRKEFQAYVDKTEKRLEEQSKGRGPAFNRPKSCYSDSSTIAAKKLAEATKKH